jgi:hypothetical protein
MLITLFPLAVPAQEPNAYLGTWTGSMATSGAKVLPLELSITETGGTWRFLRGGTGTRENPCVGKEFPVTVVSRSQAELQFEVKGSSVIQGCVDEPGVLRPVDAQNLEGTLKDGRAIKLTRK